MDSALLYTVTIDRRQLRFFKTPWDDGRPDLPWHSVEDMLRVLRKLRQFRRFFLPRTASMEIIEIEGEGIIVAPHFLAHEFFEFSNAPIEVIEAYALGCATALHQLPGGDTVGYRIHAHIRHDPKMAAARTVDEFNAAPEVSEKMRRLLGAL
jgi:hypothetical protein